MLVGYLLHFCPLVYNFRSKFFDTLGTQVSNFSGVVVAVEAKVIEKDVDQKFLRQYFTLVFTDILWRELHLASADVVAVLDKSCIEHNSANHLLAKALVREDDFGVSTHCEGVALFFSQQHMHRAVFYFVLLCCRVRKYFRHC